MKLTDVLQGLGGPVAYYPQLALAIGGVKKAIFVCQLLYWDGKQADREGWIRKPQSEITAETGLSRDESDGVRKALVKDGILEEDRRGEKGELHFRINKNCLNEIWENYLNPGCLRKIHNQENPQFSLRKTHISDCGKSTNTNVENPQSLSNAEITTEITPENNTSFAIAQEVVRDEKKPTLKFAKETITAIYAAYPRKVAPREAHPAIDRALKRIARGEEQPPDAEVWPPPDPGAWLLQRTQAYTEARKTSDPQYTPHPTTFFNKGRYSDHPTEWPDRSQQNGNHSRQPEQLNVRPAKRTLADVDRLIAEREARGRMPEGAAPTGH